MNNDTTNNDFSALLALFHQREIAHDIERANAQQNLADADIAKKRLNAHIESLEAQLNLLENDRAALKEGLRIMTERYETAFDKQTEYYRNGERWKVAYEGAKKTIDRLRTRLYLVDRNISLYEDVVYHIHNQNNSDVEALVSNACTTDGKVALCKHIMDFTRDDPNGPAWSLQEARVFVEAFLNGEVKHAGGAPMSDTSLTSAALTSADTERPVPTSGEMYQAGIDEMQSRRDGELDEDTLQSAREEHENYKHDMMRAAAQGKDDLPPLMGNRLLDDTEWGPRFPGDE